MEAIGVQAGTKADRLPAISDEVIDALRAPADELGDLLDAAEATRKLAESYRSEAEQVKVELDAAAVRYGGQGITGAYRKCAGLIRALEERLGIG